MTAKQLDKQVASLSSNSSAGIGARTFQDALRCHAKSRARIARELEAVNRRFGPICFAALALADLVCFGRKLLVLGSCVHRMLSCLTVGLTGPTRSAVKETRGELLNRCGLC